MKGLEKLQRIFSWHKQDRKVTRGNIRRVVLKVNQHIFKAESHWCKMVFATVLYLLVACIAAILVAFAILRVRFHFNHKKGAKVVGFFHPYWFVIN
jgi:hypothetical protein